MTNDPLLLRFASLLNAMWAVSQQARQRIIDTCCPDDTDPEKIRGAMLDLARDMGLLFGIPDVDGPSFKQLCDATDTWAFYDPTVVVSATVRPAVGLIPTTEILDSVRASLGIVKPLEE
jgi:hypothetical protein